VINTRMKRISGLAFAAMFVVAACGGGAATTAPSAAPSTAATDAPSAEAPSTGGGESMAPVTCSIAVVGSSTVEPIATGVAEGMKAANPDFNFTVEGPGTGDGFKRFCAGETDIATASRAIKPEGEADVCATAGVEYVELKVAYDGITVMTNPNNDAHLGAVDFGTVLAVVLRLEHCGVGAANQVVGRR